jgi:hypothetical protein
MKLCVKLTVCAIAALLGLTAGALADESVLSVTAPNDAEPSARVFTIDDLNSFSPVQGSDAEMTEEFDEIAPTIGDDFYTPYSRGGGLTGGAELSFLRPYAAQRMMTLTETDMGFCSAFRTWIGYQHEDGLGGRARFFQFDNAATNGEWLASLEFKAIDLELTQRVDFRRWNLLFSGGIRQAETANYFVLDELPSNLSSFGGFSGVGVTFSAQATRDLTSTGTLQLVASARWSSLFGNGSRLNSFPVRGSQDETLNILELTFGPQYQRELSHGMLLTIYGGLETQTWAGAIDGGDDIGLAGFTTGISILR